jgi:hypothetical protein
MLTASAETAETPESKDALLELQSKLSAIIPKKVAKKCLLPGCEKTTTHNGGYCCADHCRERTAQLRMGDLSNG